MAASDGPVSNDISMSTLNLEPVQTISPASYQQFVDVIHSRLRGDNADKISFSREEAEGLIRLLSAAKATATSTPNLLEQETVKKDLKALKAHARLGDYAGYLFNCLKKETTFGGDLEKHADVLSERLESRHSAAGARDTVVGSFKRSVVELSRIDSRMNEDVASFAIQAYGRRNKACHSGLLQRKADGDWSGLADQIETDLSELKSILPDDQLHHSDKWTRIIEFFRDQKISKDPSTGQWGPKQVQPVPEEDPQANDEDVQFVDDQADEPTVPFSAERSASTSDNLSPPRCRHGGRSEPVSGSPLKRKLAFSDESPTKRLQRSTGLEEFAERDTDKNEEKHKDSVIQALLEDFEKLKQRYPGKYPEVRDKFREDIEKKLDSLGKQEAKANRKAARASRRGETAA